MPDNTLPQLLARARARAPVWAALMRLDRPIGTLLLLWPTLWSLWIAARGVPDPGVLLVFVAGVTVMRAAGCVINDYADRHFDALVERTRQRPFATGKVGTGEALGLFAVLAAIAFALVLTQNALTIQLSFVGLALAVIYPFMKRHTWVPQLFLGAAFGWGIPMAYAAEAGALDRFAWLLFIANLLWTVAYDTWYAMVDRPDDIKVGIRSTAILFGSADRAIIAALQAAALLTLVLVGRGIEAGWPYWLGLAGAAGTFAWQRHITASRQRSSYFAAFLHNNWSGAVVFAGIAADFALRGAAAG